MANYVSSDEETIRRCPGPSGNTASQPAPGWLKPNPGNEAQDSSAWPAWTATRPSSSGIAHTPAHRRTMMSSASAMAVAQALAKAAESAAVATKRAADTLHMAGARMEPCGQPPAKAPRHTGQAQAQRALATAPPSGVGRGPRVRTPSDLGAGGHQPRRGGPRAAVLPAHDTPLPSALHMLQDPKMQNSMSS